MSKKFLFTFGLLIAFIFTISISFSYATDGNNEGKNMLNDTANGVRNVVGGAENAVEGAVRDVTNGSKNMMKYNPQGLIECGKIRPPKNDSVPTQSTIGKRPSRANAYKQEFTNYPTDLIEFAFEQKPIHPTQKPLNLMKYFIATYSDENDYVLDNTMGVGTTCLAANELNRKFIGIEKEVKYYDLAVARVFW